MRYAGATFEKYKAKRLPAVYIMDREGKVRYQKLPLEAVEAAVQRVSPAELGLVLLCLLGA